MARPDDQPGGNGVSRRLFIKTVGGSAAATSLAAAGSAAAETIAAARREDDAVRGPGPIPITLNINGQDRSAKLEPATTLLDALRLHHNLTGSKEICDRGSCGGCSVLVDGKLTVSCMMLATDAEGTKITTVEGLSGGGGGKLDPVQEAFIRHDALQCGYCTPGLVVACRALLDKNPKPNLEQIKQGLAGNICRCGTYTNIFNAVLDASGQPPIADPAGTGGAR